MRRASLLLALIATAILPLAAEPLPPPVVIFGFSPATAAPQGGSFVSITGAGFLEPVRVFFELGDLKVEAFVVSVTQTRLEVLTPPVLLGPDEQMRAATIAVESRGYRATREGFVFEHLMLQPRITVVSPNTGPKSGGARVTIFGEGFQEPVQVLFGDAEGRVLYVTRTQIVAETPEVPDLRVVDVTVRNINSGTEDTRANAFRYVVDPKVTSVTPNHGRAGTDITILGEGFRAPVAVTVAGIQAQPLLVTGTKIVARTQPAPTCGSLTGAVTVVNVVDGSLAEGPVFTYEAPPVEIAAINPRATVAGRTIEVQMEQEGDYAFAIGGISADVVAHDGSKYRVRVPTTLTFPTGTCTLRGIEGTGPVESRYSVHALDRRGLCTATRPNALTVAPAAPVTCTLPPLATVLPRSWCSIRTVTIANERGRADLTIAAPENVEPRTAVIRGGEKQTFTIAPRMDFERLRFETNDPRHPWLLVCVSP